MIRAVGVRRVGSNNRAKARLKVARVHARIADRRRDHLHKLSTRIIRENQTVVIEDLSVRNMVRNHSLARAISDAAWSELRRQLEPAVRDHRGAGDPAGTRTSVPDQSTYSSVTGR
ncbi:transposase [Micromonospora inyonensis]|uniref:transposase n=1 Tax=Micromonospora inyonensis TaxID=47866 RepID=UPI000AE2EA66